MPRTLSSASLLCVLLLGCSQLPMATDGDSCTALFEQLQGATRAQRDAQYQPLEGFAGLRSERTLAALGANAQSRAQRRLWLQRLAARDAEASIIELAQLADEPRRLWSSPQRQQALSTCRSRQVERLLDNPHAFARAVAAAQVADDYRTWARVAGLYPLFKPIFARGVAAWQHSAARAKAPTDGAQWLGYQPLPSRTQTISIRLVEDALGLPQAQPAELEALFNRHTPWLKVEQASRSDRLGSPQFRADGTRGFNQQHIRLYRHSGWSRLQGRWHLQLSYQFWFSQRPKPHALDLFGGELDGLSWVDARRSLYPGVSYQTRPLDHLRQLPHPQGQRSLYRADGLIAGSQRLERWLLWPAGVKSPGAMRQWGRHATAFIGRAHFDDPYLLERYFQQIG